MSQPNNEDMTSNETPIESNAGPTEAEIVAAFEDESEQIDNRPKEKTPKPKDKKPKKKLSKKAKIIIGLSAWLLLLGGAVGLAFLLRPAAEVAHLAPVVEEFKWQEPTNIVELDPVDIDYYGYYDTNSISFEKAASDYSSPYSNVVYVRGLKNKAVENKINSRIKAIVDELIPQLKNEYAKVQVTPAANLYNVLSLRFNFNTYENNISEYYTYGATFNLNTGDELSFDDIFIDNFDYAQYVQKAFYDHLSTELSFSLQSIGRTITVYERNPDACGGMYMIACDDNVSPSETIKSYYSKRDDLKSKLADIENYSQTEAKKYLEGNKLFYLNSYGPAFISEDHKSATTSEAKDQAKYLAYYRDYKTTSSLFENDSIGDKHIFYTTPVGYLYASNWDITETDSYLLEQQHSSDDENPAITKAYKDYILSRIMKKVEAQPQFYWIQFVTNTHQVGSSGRKYNYYEAYTELNISTTSKDYYNSTFRKAIIDGKTQSSMGAFQPARLGHYDEAKVQTFTDKDVDSFTGGVNALIDGAGNIYANAEEIFNPDSNWMEYLKNYFYSRVGSYSAGNFIYKTYTDAEKSTHDIGVVLNGSSLYIGIKDNNTQNRYGFSEQTYLPVYYVPNEYLKEPFWH